MEERRSSREEAGKERRSILELHNVKTSSIICVGCSGWELLLEKSRGEGREEQSTPGGDIRTPERVRRPENSTT